MPMLNRRSILSALALLAPGSLARAAEAAVAPETKSEPGPDPAREATLSIDGRFYAVSIGPEGATARPRERAEVLGHLPQPEPAGFFIYRPKFEASRQDPLFGDGNAVRMVWDEDPTATCARCPFACNAYRNRESGDHWRCHHVNTDLGPQDPGFLGYY